MAESTENRKAYSFSLDRETVDGLRVLAEMETEGNMSQMIRFMVRDGIARRHAILDANTTHQEKSA